MAAEQQADFQGKIAIVTGAGGGIGRAEAMRLAADGAAVVVNDYNAEAAEETASLIRDAGGQAATVSGDVSSMAVAEEAVRTAVDSFGRLDVLINNAGNSRPRFIVNMTEEEWDSVIDTHVKGTFAFISCAARHWQAEFKRTGEPVNATIVNTTSVNGLHGQPGYVNYVAAKGAIASITVMLAKELASFGVRVNAIAPLARSEMSKPLWGTEVFADDRVDELSPEMVAQVVGWLAAPRSAPITGEIVNFSGARLNTFVEWPEKGSATSPDRLWDYAKLDAARDELFGG